MSEIIEIGRHVVLHYASSVSSVAAGKHENLYWSAGSLFRTVGNRSFARGDVALLQSIEVVSPDECIFHVDVLGCPDLKEVPDEVLSAGEIPSLLFLTTRIPINSKSVYELYPVTSGVEVLIFRATHTHGNQQIIAAVAMRGNHAKVEGRDTLTGDTFEFIISDTSA